MSPGGSGPQREERPVGERDGRTSREEEYAARTTEDRGESRGDPDVLLDVPLLNVEEIDLEVEDLRARVSFQAELADLVKINVGLDVELGKVKLGIRGVEAKAQLKARLDNVRAIFSEVLESLEHNPQFFRDVAGTVDRSTGSSETTTARGALDTGEAGDAPDAPPIDVDAEVSTRVEATKAARKKAEELGLELSTLEGTGSGGRVVVRDVIEAARD